MTPPCEGCKHRELSKVSPIVYLNNKRPRGADGKFLVGNRTARVIPGVSKVNPCYKCEKCYEYDRWIDESFTGPPSHWDDVVGFQYKL